MQQIVIAARSRRIDIIGKWLRQDLAGLLDNDSGEGASRSVARD
jgi:hypothetical protein